MHENHTTDQAVEDYLEAAEPDYIEAPLKVSVVGDVSTESHRPRTITTETYVLKPGDPLVRILPELRTRDRARIMATSGYIVVGGPTLTAGSGFPIGDSIGNGGNACLEITSTDALYALAPVGNVAVSVAVLSEHRDG